MKQVKLNDVIEFARNGAAIKQSEDAKGFPISRIETIWNSTIDEDRLGYADIYDEDLIKYEKYLLKENDILITHINSPKHLGKSAIYTGYPEKLIHGMNLLCLRNNPNFSNSKYLFYYFQTKYFKNQIHKISNQSVNQASFAVTNLKELEIPLPNLPTQQKIANILDKADELRQYNKQLIEKYEALTQSLFLDMFGDPVKNEKGFPLKKLEELYISKKEGTKCGPFGGALKKDEFVKKGIPVWNMDNISKKGELVSEINLWITKEKYDILNSYSVINDDIIISRAGTVGKMCVVKTTFEKSIISTNLIRLRLDKNLLLPLFFVSLMTYFKERISRLQTGAEGAFTHMNTGVLNDIIFPYPPIELQNQFAERVAMIEAQKQQAQEALVKSEALFQGLLQQAFNGELNTPPYGHPS